MNNVISSMMRLMIRVNFILILGTLLVGLVGCNPAADRITDERMSETQFVWLSTKTPPQSETQQPAAVATQIPTPVHTPEVLHSSARVWISPAVPEHLQSLLQWGDQLTPVPDAQSADLQLVILPDWDEGAGPEVSWLYVLAAPFPTILDEVALEDLKDAWRGAPPPHLENRPIYMTESTRLAFQSIWGPPREKIAHVAQEEALLDMAWADQPSLALLPFEALDPRWKIIRVDGYSPLQPGVEIEGYPLTLRFGLRGDSRSGDNYANKTNGLLPSSNFDRDRLTSVIMTGVTALARSTALRMEEEGVLYPAQDIAGILRTADFTHISNEAPFYDQCPPAKPLRKGMRFCSDPRYIELLDEVGANIIELTGNHLLDWGIEAMRYTLDLYQERGLSYFGGGYDEEEARNPLLVEHNGNRLAFLGCNVMGPEAVFATANTPGAARCDYEWMETTVHRLREQGYLPIVTFQSIELDNPRPHSIQRVDFNRMSEAGAVIVSGSQAHVPQAMAFSEDRFIHYGLGNLFFDQMESWQRPQFIDLHTFYDGRYIHTELLTTMLEDSARPRLMTEDERQRLLMRIFEASGW
jgi:hypothetical protein